MKPISTSLSLVLLVATVFVVQARAGQVRVEVGLDNGLTFSPSEVNLNLGDHVVWIWRTGSHTVSQGSGCVVPGNRLFDSGATPVTNARFSWRSNQTGTIPYFCRLHCDMGMTGTLNVAAGGVAVADFRITEIKRSNDHVDDYIEIANLGDAAGNLALYRIATTINNAVALTLADLVVPAGGRIVAHIGVNGTNTSTDIYVPGASLAALGSVAFLVPNTITGLGFDATQIIDFAIWGSSTAGNADLRGLASEAGIWPPGNSLPLIPDGFALEFCGTSNQRGAAFWAAVSSPTPREDGNCSTPALPVTWGALKSRY